MKPVFHFDVQGSVAKSPHAGIPWLKRLRDEAGEPIHFWPLDGWVPAPGKSVVEVYPSIFAIAMRGMTGRGMSRMPAPPLAG